MSLSYRSDIDGLRAVAVGSVVLFHAHIPPFRGGFIGVDVFFVISGFLITSILYRDISARRFSLVDFYDRRVRRIFPALFVVLAATTLIGALFLMPRQMMRLVDTLVPSALFYANIHFEQILNYFGPRVDETPLLHLWSLAVEEQFYIFFPLLLFVLMKGGRTLAVGVLAFIAIASLVHAQSIVDADQPAAFFLLQSRVWELLAGSLLALVAWPRMAPRIAAWIAVAGLLAILAPVFLYDQDTLFPGLTAVPPVLGAAAIIFAGAYAPNGIVSRLLSLRPMVYVGRISYSLYLWHWPLLILAAIYKGGHLTYLQAAGVVLVAGALSALSLTFVETPLRRPGVLGGRRLARIGAGACAILLMCGAAFAFERAGGGFFPISPRGAAAEAAADDKSRFQSDCNNMHLRWVPSAIKSVEQCALGADAARGTYDVLVWGDSHAGATFIGIAEDVAAAGQTARLQTMPGCPPLIGGLAWRDQSSPRICAQFNATVLDEIKRVRPKVVVLVGRWSLWTKLAGRGFMLTSAEVPGGEARTQASSRKVFAHMVERTLAELTGLGLQVVVLGQSPEYALAPARCVATREFFGGDASTCLGQSREEALRSVGYADDVLKAAAAGRPGVSLFLMSDAFCRGESCTAGDGERFFYVDTDHLSATGARFAGENPALRATLAAALKAGGGTSAQLKQ